MKITQSHLSHLFSLFVLIIVYCTNTAAVAGLIKDQTLIVDGKTRTCDVYVPNRHFGKALPLVPLLHGHMSDADVMGLSSLILTC